MSSSSNRRTMPLFVNTSQMQKYGCSHNVSSTVVSDRDADQSSVIQTFSTLPSMDFHTRPSSSACLNDVESSYKRDSRAPYLSNSASPVFGRQKPVKLTTDPNFMAVNDSMRTVEKDPALVLHVDVDKSSKSPPSRKSEDSDGSSPVRSRKRKRFHRRRLLTYSDSSDEHSSDCGEKAYKSSSANYCVNDESVMDRTVAKCDTKRLSNLESRHCFDLLLNCEKSNAVTNSKLQSFQQVSNEPSRTNDVWRDRIFQSVCEFFDGELTKESDRAKRDVIDSRSSQCSVRLHRLQLCDVSSRIVLSQEDKCSLSGECTVDNNKNLSASSDSIHRNEVVVNNGSTLKTSYVDSDELFSDNEAVESVCLSPSHYCFPGEQQDNEIHDISKPVDNELEGHGADNEPEVPFVSYSQAEDDCILIDDSDDELFANLTQTDVTVKVEDDDDDDVTRQTDEDVECVSADDDDKWTLGDVDVTAAAADARHSVGEMSITPAPCDPWISDIADVSSDELEEAYNAAMNSAHRAAAHDFDSSMARQQIDSDDNDAVIISDARLDLFKQCRTSPCIVSLKPLRMSDIPPEIHLSGKDKYLSVRDIVAVNGESCSDMLPESDRSNSVFTDVYRKPEAALKSSKSTEPMDSEKLAHGMTFLEPVRKPNTSTVQTVQDTVCAEPYKAPLKWRACEEFSNPASVSDTSELMRNAGVKCKYDKRSRSSRIALEDCIEVAEFYGTNVRAAAEENRWRKHDSAVVRETKQLDALADSDHRNSSRLMRAKEDRSHLMPTAPPHARPDKLHSFKLGDDGVNSEEEEWMGKSSVHSSSTNSSGSSFQCHKISQLRDYGKKKLRRDKTSLTSGRSHEGSDRFQGLSQFSVAKQQLIERNRQLKSDGLYCCCLSV